MRSVQISEWVPRACAIRLGVIVKLAEREGFEPSRSAIDPIICKDVIDTGKAQSSPIASLNSAQACLELSEIVASWALLPEGVRAALLVLIRSNRIDSIKEDGMK